jgi:hypothetical protein
MRNSARWLEEGAEGERLIQIRSAPFNVNESWLAASQSSKISDEFANFCDTLI